MKVADPCKTVIDDERFDKYEIQLVLGTTAPINLQYKKAQHSAYWLLRCVGLSAMELSGQPSYASISAGVLKLNLVNACSNFALTATRQNLRVDGHLILFNDK